MKFKQLDKEQKTAFTSFFSNIQNIKSQEEQALGFQFYRLLIIGNGTGIFLLSAFMGALAGNDQSFKELLSPLFKFLVGASLAASILFLLMSVAYQATSHLEKQFKEIFLNKLDIESFEGYGLSKRGIRLVSVLIFASIAMFIWGVIECAYIIKSY